MNNPCAALDALLSLSVFFPVSLVLFLLESYGSSGCNHSFSLTIYTFSSKISIVRRAKIPKIYPSGEKCRDDDPDERDLRTMITSARDYYRYSCDGITEADFQKTPFSSFVSPLPPGPIQRQRDWATPSGLDSGRVNLSPSHAPLPRDEEGAAPLKKKERKEIARSSKRERRGHSIMIRPAKATAKASEIIHNFYINNG